MDQPHNQFLYKELVYSHITTHTGHSWMSYTGHMFKINLYSTGNIDLFKKNVEWSSGVEDPTSFITIFYSTKIYTKGNGNGCDITYNINDYLDKITFVPTEHLSSFHMSDKPINYDIVHFIEYILERNKGVVSEKDFEIIHFTLQKETENMELYHQTLHLNKIILVLLYLVGILILFIIVYFIIRTIYKIYETLYADHYDI